MITTKTVFILGAGASKPYQLPVGRELYQEVPKDFLSDTAKRQEFLNITSFSTGHKFSGLVSVDAFLERRSEFVEIGKAIIAFELLNRERVEPLSGEIGNWMQYLYQHMTTLSLDEFVKNLVSFITYNYDRTLEHFMLTSLMNTYGEDETACANALSGLPIIHLHGRLGYLPWQGKKTIHVPFQCAGLINPHIVEACQKEMRIVHEDIADRDDEFKRARGLLQNARRIYFMGFAYAPQNVGRLNYARVPESAESEGTALGLTSKECAVAKALFQDRTFNLHSSMNCLDFLRERANFT